MLFTPAQYSRAGINSGCKLAEIKDFQGLAPKSLGVNVPVFALTDEELETKGAALEAQRNNRETFHEIYTTVANMIIQVLI
jgi:chromosome partitioning protein